MEESEPVDYEGLLRVINSGAAVCLLGAGFSTSANQADDVTPVPDTSQLTEHIKELLDVPSDVAISLADAAEVCEEGHADRIKLNTLLIQKLTSTKPSVFQRRLVEYPWRAIFTTNFDDVVEVARGSLAFTPVTPATDLTVNVSSRTPIYYLHGRALDLRENDRNPSFVISESNYLKLNSRNKLLYARLFNEIICARAIIICGYSLRDLDIAKEFLNSSGSLKAKTYIVVHPDDTGIAIRRLRKFGTVVPLGLEGFIRELESVKVDVSNEPSCQYLREFRLEHSPSLASAEITGDEFLKTVLTGRLEPGKIAMQQFGNDTPYCVMRDKALDIVKSSSQQRFIVSSDFGNGKTGFLAQLASSLYTDGRKVYFIETKLPDIFSEIDYILGRGDPVAFLIDDVVRYRNVASYVGARLHNQAILVCTTRGDQDAQYEQIAGELGGAHRSVDLNILTDSEVDAWNHLLERWGYWELKSALSEENRRTFIVEHCGRENRSIILSLFEDSRIANKIDELVNFFLKRNSQYLDAFCGLLIASLAQKHLSWESLAGWLDIDEADLRQRIRDDDISYLFSGGRDWNFLTSAQLAEYILKNKFVEAERDILVDVYSTIVLSTAESADDALYGHDFRENLKELMKFRFLEKLFGETDASGILIGRVYKNLSQASRIRGNPQFWLQYAMSRIKAGDLDNAESFIKTALGRASQRGMDYDPYQIKDQRARLYFLKNTKSSYVSRNEINQALDDLTELARNQSFDIVYTMRSLPLIENFLEERIDDIELGTREKIVEFLALLKEKTVDFDRLPRSQRGETKVLRKALTNVELILFNA